ncbi:MAG: hypothetical protein PGN12_07315 [Sphingomonas phyllosphaerae]
MPTIDLEALTGEGRVQNLSGRLRGLAARELFQVDALDHEDAPVEVRVPDYVYSLTPSFFQGLFGRSVQTFGQSEASFRRHFHFVAPAIVLQQIEQGLSAALTSRNLGDVN